MEISEISKNYQVRRLGRDDVDAIYELCRENRIFYRYHEPFVTKESILDDMEALPPGKSREDKYYIGFFDGGSLAAIMDLILGYPEADSAWMGWFILFPAFIGLFMTDVRYQHRGVGSQIISGLAAYLSSCGCEKIRLGVDKGNPQSHAFWRKNRFQTIGEARYIVMEREI
mgnify:CR=1 FL=1